jgi:hypothetical protein
MSLLNYAGITGIFRELSRTAFVTNSYSEYRVNHQNQKCKNCVIIMFQYLIDEAETMARYGTWLSRKVRGLMLGNGLRRGRDCGAVWNVAQSESPRLDARE